MNVTRLNRSKTTWTTVPLAFGNFLVSFLNASAGMTASVVSTVARAMVPLNAIAPVFARCSFLVFAPDLGLEEALEMPGLRVEVVLPRARGDAGADWLELGLAPFVSSERVLGEDDLLPGVEAVVGVWFGLGISFVVVSLPSDEDLWRPVEFSFSSGERFTGEATRRPSVSSASWLTSELALGRLLLVAVVSSIMVISPFSSSSFSMSSSSLLSSGGGVQESLISSVKSVKIEKREESVPPVDTSFKR